MGYYRDLDLNESIEIQTPTGLVKITVKNITGSLKYKEADVEIMGVQDITSLHLIHDTGLSKLMDNLAIGVITPEKERSKRVRINVKTPYLIHKDYTNN